MTKIDQPNLQEVVLYHIWLAIVELPGVWSPEEQPEAAVIERDQLFEIIREALDAYDARIAKRNMTRQSCEAVLLGIRDSIPIGFLRANDIPGVKGPTEKLDLVGAVQMLASEYEKLRRHREVQEYTSNQPTHGEEPEQSWTAKLALSERLHDDLFDSLVDAKAKAVTFLEEVDSDDELLHDFCTSLDQMIGALEGTWPY